MFIDKLTSLNRSVLGWACKHIEQNAAVDLSPVFDVSPHNHDYNFTCTPHMQDYMKHLRELKHKFSLDTKPVMKSEVKPQPQPPVFSATAKPTFAFGVNNTSTTGSQSSATFAFGQPSATTQNGARVFTFDHYFDTVLQWIQQNQPTMSHPRYRSLHSAYHRRRRQRRVIMQTKPIRRCRKRAMPSRTVGHLCRDVLLNQYVTVQMRLSNRKMKVPSSRLPSLLPAAAAAVPRRRRSRHSLLPRTRHHSLLVRTQHHSRSLAP